MPKMKNAFVTGGSGAIGSTIAENLKKRGYNVVIGYFSHKEKAEKVAKSIGCDAEYIDVSNSLSVDSAFNNFRKKFGKITVLVNCAGIALKQKVISDVTEDEFDRLYSVNVKGAFLCSKAVIPDMLESGFGDIVNVSSIWGIDGASCEVPYSATKGALNAFTLALADELSLSSVKVNAVAPGFVDTPMNAHLSEEDKAAFIAENGLSSLTSAEQVAKTVLSLIDGKDTGKIIRVENKLN